VPAHARLDQAQAMAGVVAAVQREHFLGVVAVAPVHARQALASLVPVWKDGQAALPLAPSLTPRIAGIPRVDRYRPLCLAHGRCERRFRHGTRGRVVPGRSYQPLAAACEADVRQMIGRELAALLQCQESALRLFSVPAMGSGSVHPLDLMDAAADAALLSHAVGRPVSVACEAGAAGTATAASWCCAWMRSLRRRLKPARWCRPMKAMHRRSPTCCCPTPLGRAPQHGAPAEPARFDASRGLATVLDAGEVRERKVAPACGMPVSTI
jgi:nicotinate dehydrogenase subunit B